MLAQILIGSVLVVLYVFTMQGASIDFVWDTLSKIGRSRTRQIVMRDVDGVGIELPKVVQVTIRIGCVEYRLRKNAFHCSQLVTPGSDGFLDICGVYSEQVRVRYDHDKLSLFVRISIQKEVLHRKLAGESSD